MKRNDSRLAAQLLNAAIFAARKHRDQRRKGAEAAPYINHPIEVAEILARIGGDQKRRSAYFDWAAAVVDGCRGTNQKIERHFDAVLREATFPGACGDVC